MPMLAPKDVDRIVRFLVRRLKEFLRLVLALFGIGGAAFAAPQPAASADIPPPYTEEELTFTNGPITLTGTLTRPAGDGPFPAVVLLTGSGPQNRDEELMGFKPFRLIADHLARRGTLVLRYDDRGVGGSSGSVAASTTDDFALDALAAIEVALSKVSVPVLAIFGERDLQVAPDLNRPALERALAQAANGRVTITVYPHANHLFQTARTGSPMEYAALEKQFVPGLLDDVARWIADQGW